ncbi:MAG TPA: serine protein kinase PrkA [Planctomycetota bacterium]|nr:serine protein kinase PrkA [Planctomycetota bacterium]
MVDLNDFLKKTNEQSLEVFKGQKRILSFQQYLDAFCANPMRLGRNAAQYVLDAFEHYGTKQVGGVGGKFTRWKLFDAPFDNGREPLIGQEPCQQELYRHLKRFAITGRADKLVLLHGPNGSAKSTLINLIVRALENYCTLDEGTLFRFNWIFSERSEGKGSMGFGRGDDLPKETLAFLEEAMISCKLTSELREPPIFLIPVEQRGKLLDDIIAANPKNQSLSDRLKAPYLREGILSAKNKQIFDALLNAHRGDWLKVVRHVQVERYFISKRYRTGASAIEPQQAVDAGARPMSFEHGVALPPVLQGLQLLDLVGELIEASGGVVEYSDFLKRNLELNKYLLSTVERGEVNLPGTSAELNCVMLGTCNEKQLSAFKATPDFTSYKGRIELVRTPYLLEWSKERAIYEPFIKEIQETRHVAPHTADVAALWAVLTRLRRPDPGRYPSDLAGVVRHLTPLDKAKLYDNGTVPDGLSTEEKRLLRSHIAALRDEHRDTLAEFEGFVCAAYEGRRGASAREMKSLLAEASSHPERKFLSPLAVFEAMEHLLRDKSVYDFLRLEPDEGYHDCESFIEQVRDEYFRWVSVEVYDSMGLVEETEYDRRVEDYFRHVRAYVAGEKVQNARTGAYEDPNAEILEGLEKLMKLRESPDAFRRNLITKIAAYSLEHPNEKIDYHEIFADLFKNLRNSYYRNRAQALIQIAQYVLVSGTDDALVPNSERPKVERTLKMMRDKYGYTDESAKEAINFVLRTIEDKNLAE